MKHYYLYRNLRTKTFSLKHGGKVIRHPSEILLKEVRFKVSEKGRQRVLKEKRKNVHATVQAKEIVESSMKLYISEEVYYDPYKTKTFINKRTKEPIYEAELVLASNNKIYIVEEV